MNSLNLRDGEGRLLALNADGTGSFLDYVKQYVLASAQRELDTHDSADLLKDLAVEGSVVEEQGERRRNAQSGKGSLRGTYARSRWVSCKPLKLCRAGAFSKLRSLHGSG